MKKIAIVELNTVNVKLVIANVLPNESYVVVEEVVEPNKIAFGLHEDLLIKPNKIKELITALQSLKAICIAHKVEDYICVATSEYKIAKNLRSFFEEVYNQSGFNFKIQEPENQVTSIYSTVVNTIDCPKGIVLNINPLTIQVLHYNRRNVLNIENLNFGTLSLCEKFNSCTDPKVLCDKIYKEVYSTISKFNWFNNLDEEVQIVGVNSTFLNLGKLSRKLRRYPYEKEHNYSLTIDDFNQVYEFTKGLDIDKTKKLKGISSDRADMLVGGFAIVKAFLDATKVKGLLVSKNSLCEGILLNTVCPLTLEKTITDILGYSLARINVAYNNYSENTDQVYSLAMILYKQLKVLHKLSRTYVKVLRIACIMHDSGKRINVNDYYRNGLSVVLNSDIYGATHREQVLAGFVVASQNAEDFNMTDWIKYKDLFLEEDLEAVRKLAVIIKLAASLDKFNKNRIADITCDILGDSVIMKTIINAPAPMEIREGEKCSVDFRKAFKKNLEIL